MTAVRLEKYRGAGGNRLLVSGLRTMTEKQFSRIAAEIKQRTFIVASGCGFRADCCVQIELTFRKMTVETTFNNVVLFFNIISSRENCPFFTFSHFQRSQMKFFR